MSIPSRLFRFKERKNPVYEGRKRIEHLANQFGMTVSLQIPEDRTVQLHHSSSKKYLDDRGAAFFIDLFISAVILCFLAIAMSPFEFPNVWLSMVVLAACWGASISCFLAAFESSAYQASPGKLLCGLRVVSAQGERLRFFQAWKRIVVKAAVPIPINLLYLATKKSDGILIHDLITRTRVISSAMPNTTAVNDN